nr:uncharacterized protein LOC109178742 [Ipomoea trifida]
MYHLLSESESPVKSDRTLEEQDLLERSTKKSKRGERSPKGPKNISMMDIVQETALASTAEPMHATSSVPPATYRQSLVGQSSCQPLENEPDEEIVSDKEEMDEANSDPDCPTIIVTKAEKVRF